LEDYETTGSAGRGSVIQGRVVDQHARDFHHVLVARRMQVRLSCTTCSPRLPQ
jgi:hypothetical protein